jgi:hypothetical protein
MTKLADWLVVGITLFTLWYNLLTGRLPSGGLTHEQILLAPFVAVAIVGIVVLATLIKRVQDSFKKYLFLYITSFWNNS